MPQIIKLSRPGGGPFYVFVDAIVVISPASFSETWQGIGARLQLMDGRWYRVSQCPEEIMVLIGPGHVPPIQAPARPAMPAGCWRDDAEHEARSGGMT